MASSSIAVTPGSGKNIQTWSNTVSALTVETQAVTLASSLGVEITTLPVSIASMPSTPVTGTFWQATQPISGSVSVSNFPASQAVTGTFWQATQPVSLATNTPDVTDRAARLLGHVTIDNASLTVSNGQTQPLTDTQLRATPVPVSGTVTANAGTGTMAVSLATNTPDVTDRAARLLGVTTNANIDVALSTRLKPADTLAGVTAVGSITNALPTGTNSIGTVVPPAITKGTQGSVGVTTQDLKDAGRAIVNVATAIAGVTAVTTEALLAVNVSRDGAATASVTTIAVTSGKRYRITGLVASVRSTSAAVLSGRVALRLNPSGAVTATSPIIAIASMTQQAAALAEAGDTCVIMFPDGIEVSGTMQVGLSQVCSAITGVVYASLIGYEY